MNLKIILLLFLLPHLPRQISIGSGNGLIPNRRQAITWTSDDPNHWCHIITIPHRVDKPSIEKMYSSKIRIHWIWIAYVKLLVKWASGIVYGFYMACQTCKTKMINHSLVTSCDRVFEWTIETDKDAWGNTWWIIYVNPWKYWILLGNIKIYLYFTSFLDTGPLSKIVDIYSHGRQDHPYCTWSISWLLMPWLLASPGHQQPCYWHSSTLDYPRLLAFTPKEDKNIHIVHGQYHGCWWPDDTRSQGISNLVIHIPHHWIIPDCWHLLPRKTKISILYTVNIMAVDDLVT